MNRITDKLGGFAGVVRNWKERKIRFRKGSTIMTRLVLLLSYALGYGSYVGFLRNLDGISDGG